MASRNSRIFNTQKQFTRGDERLATLRQRLAHAQNVAEQIEASGTDPEPLNQQLRDAVMAVLDI